MPIPAAVPIGIAAVGIGSSLFGASKAKKAAKKAAKEQSNLTYMKRQEEIRQRKKEAGRELGAGRAAVGASNLQFSGSAQRYLDQMDFENMRDIAWAEDAAQRERKAIRAGAQGMGDQLLYQAAGDAIGYAAQAYANRSQPSPVSQPFGPNNFLNTTPTSDISSGNF